MTPEQAREIAKKLANGVDENDKPSGIAYPLRKGWKNDFFEAKAIEEIWPKVVAHNTEVISAALLAAVHEEREACAKRAEASFGDGVNKIVGVAVATEIRSRSKERA